MPSSARPSNNFPGVRQHLRRLGTADAPARADALANELSTLHSTFNSSGAYGAAAALERIDRDVASASVDTLRRTINREQVIDELYDVGEKKSRALGRVRNIFALLPLLWTWLVLWWAASAYESDLKAHDNLYVRPFLELWQQNFGGRIPFTFAQAALVDAVLIGIVVLYTVRVNHAERAEERNVRSLITQFDDALDDLFAMLARNIDELLPDDAKPAKWAEVTRAIIREAMEGARTLADENGKVVATAQATIRTMADSLTETLRILEAGNEAFINGAIGTVKTVVTEANSATEVLVQTGVTPLVANLRDQVNRHSQAVEGLSHNVTRLGTASETLAEKARDHTALTQDIDTRLDTINTSLVGFSSGVVDVATQMRNAAEGVQYVLGGASRENVEQTAADILEASRVLTEATRQLSLTTRSLQQVAGSLTPPVYPPPWGSGWQTDEDEEEGRGPWPFRWFGRRRGRQSSQPMGQAYGAPQPQAPTSPQYQPQYQPQPQPVDPRGYSAPGGPGGPGAPGGNPAAGAPPQPRN